jgi:ankyrin repeat protein
MDANQATANQHRQSREDALRGDPSAIFPNASDAALARAAAAGDLAQVRTLVAGGARLDAKGIHDITLLQWAIMHESVPAVDTLLEAGANPSQLGEQGKTAIAYAAQSEDAAYLRSFLSHHANPNAPDDDGNTPMGHALLVQNPEPTDLLLKAGANLNAHDSLGNSILDAAASTNNFARVLQFLQLGADPRAANPRGQTFQVYLPSQQRLHMYTAAARQTLEQIDAWLQAHNVPIASDRRG